MSAFYAGVTDSSYLDWLAEYDTFVAPVGGGAGTNQAIGRGTFLGPPFDITPLAANDGTTIDDANIQDELRRQLVLGVLPAPTTDGAGHPNTLYLIHFPKGKTITLAPASSCASGGFCAYHGTSSFLVNGVRAYYAVLPDMSAGSGCDRGCGMSAPFDNQTAVAAHEMAEVLTDPEVGVATAFAPPLAWYDQTNGELADICNGLQGTVTGGDGVVYTVSQLFSNVAGQCLVTRNDFAIGLSPTSQILLRGSSTAFTVDTAATLGGPEAIALSLSALPAGLTASFSPPSVAAGSSSTLTVSASAGAALGTVHFTVTGTAPSATHAVAGSVAVSGPDFSIALAPASAVLVRGFSTPFTVTTAATMGNPETIALSLSALPAGLTGSFGPASVATGGSSTLTIAASAEAALGDTAFVVTGTSPSASHAAVGGVTVNLVLAVAPASSSLAPRAAQTFAASGGSGAGYAWSLPTNASGGTIHPATGAYQAGPAGSVTDQVRVTDSLGGTADASVAVTAGVSISPPTVAVQVGKTQAFAAAGGSGTGYAWSLSTNRSGGSIGAATGAYQAGPSGGVTDVVEVADSLGNVASASVTVTGVPVSSRSGSGCGCGAGGGDPLTLLALALAAVGRRWRADRRTRQASRWGSPARG